MAAPKTKDNSEQESIEEQSLSIFITERLEDYAALSLAALILIFVLVFF